jgi:hypothetical protein
MEDLRRKVKPKLVLAAKELKEVEIKFRAH